MQRRTAARASVPPRSLAILGFKLSFDLYDMDALSDRLDAAISATSAASARPDTSSAVLRMTDRTAETGSHVSTGARRSQSAQASLPEPA